MKKKEKLKKNKITSRWLILKKWNSNIDNFKKTNKKQSNKLERLTMRMKIKKINKKGNSLKIMNWVRIWGKEHLDKWLSGLIRLPKKRLLLKY